MTLQPVAVAFAITLGLSSLLSYPTLAQIQVSTLLSKTPPPPPRQPPPHDPTIPGGPGGGL